MDSAQELLDGIRWHRSLIQPSLALDGSLTPAEAAGLTVPEIPGYNRLISMVAASHRYQEAVARGGVGPASEHGGGLGAKGPEN